MLRQHMEVQWLLRVERQFFALQIGRLVVDFQGKFLIPLQLVSLHETPTSRRHLLLLRFVMLEFKKYCRLSGVDIFQPHMQIHRLVEHNMVHTPFLSFLGDILRVEHGLRVRHRHGHDRVYVGLRIFETDAGHTQAHDTTGDLGGGGLKEVGVQRARSLASNDFGSDHHGPRGLDRQKFVGSNRKRLIHWSEQIHKYLLHLLHIHSGNFAGDGHGGLPLQHQCPRSEALGNLMEGVRVFGLQGVGVLGYARDQLTRQELILLAPLQDLPPIVMPKCLSEFLQPDRFGFLQGHGWRRRPGSPTDS
mmetsp:Transcript_42865/g.97755  ORF Transcript_42865/g.97755 Transcript_42865/m.97755 type:complete len:304 (-) Transcript_42865:10-921(-)